jgi:phosphatidate cytidylyltransferase
LGGIVFAVSGALVVGYFIDLEWYMSIIAGLLCTVFAQIGDLSESLIKRDAGVKDSGDTLPGHGGFLDRTDSFVFTIPIMYYFCYYFIFHKEILIDFIKSFRGLI